MKFLVLLYLSLQLFGNDFSSLNQIKADISEFSKYNSKTIDVSEYANGQINNQSNIIMDSLYKDTKFMTREEFDEIYNDLNQLKDRMQSSAYTFLFYFTTEDVPEYSVTNTLLQLSILQDNKINISSKIYLMGPPEDFKGYLFKMRDYLDKYPIKYQEKVTRNFNLKFGPDFFEVYNIQKAPAMAIAYCSVAIPSPDKCNIPFVIRGDVSLEYFFNEISKKDIQYKKYYELIKNNLINYQLSTKDMVLLDKK